MSGVAGGLFLPPEDLPYDQPDEIGDLSRSFRYMTGRLGELDRLKAEFVGIASHELKTPANVIRGYAEMMEDGFYGPVTEEQQVVLDQIREQTDYLTERVNQLLSVSRMEAKGLEMETRQVPLREVLEGIRAAYAPVAARRDISLRVVSDPSAPSAVSLDTHRVQNELFGNLLSNAFKFTRAGGEVILSARGVGESVVFELKDTGEGIPRSELPFIFEKYYQAGSHTGKVGAGLGLAIAREVVEAHGGTIGADSAPGRGTTFHIELPIGANGRESPAEGGMET
jgi:signal transduction histidine kinase